MPDWTYHPFFKPLLFRLPGEAARRVTLRLLAIQGKTSLGRGVFRLMGHVRPPKSLEVQALGLTFPCAVGVAQGIDTEAIAISVLQYLCPGFVIVGPAGVKAKARRLATDPFRIDEHLALCTSPDAAGLGAQDLARRIRAAPDLHTPVGVALRGPDLEQAVAAAGDAASFLVLPTSCAADEETLRRLCSSTQKPVVLRLSADLEEGRLDEVTDRAVRAGVRGVVAMAGLRCELMPDGEMTGPFLRDRSLAAVRRIVARHGDALDVVGAGGIMTPDDALAFLDAGAKLVELYEGLVYAGPGFPARIIHELEARIAKGPATRPLSCLVVNEVHGVSPVSERGGVNEVGTSTETQSGKGWILLAFTGLVLIASGIGALVIAATVKMLPYDAKFLGMTREILCERNACRIVHFMAHDRVSFGGALISIGATYLWLAKYPLREGKAWAWWALVLSGSVGFASFLTYLGYGYLDVWHGIATLLLLPVYVIGLIWTWGKLRRPRGLGTIFHRGAAAWLWSPAGMGRALVTFAALGMILGGATIMSVGMTRVFVPQDLEYMQISVQELNAINPRLVPLIAHDRAGFGGGLFSGGIAVMLALWCGARPGQRALWVALLIAGLVGFGCAIGVHPIVGYTSLTHLAPAYAGAGAFLLGMVLLYRPLWHGDPSQRRFSDFR